MTTPLSAPSRPAGRGLTLVLATAVVLGVAWTCAILYVLTSWTLG
ncbi:hypothetical protein ABTY59_35305 [Streptomyces sp. NPDC096079]